MRITIFEGTRVKFKSGRYQHVEITCQSDFTLPRLVIYTYKRSTRWFFRAVHRAGKRSDLTTDPPTPSDPQTQREQQKSSSTRQRILRIEAEIHGLEDLFHIAPVGLHRSNKRLRSADTQGRWFQKPEKNRFSLGGKPSCVEPNLLTELSNCNVPSHDSSQLNLESPPITVFPSPFSHTESPDPVTKNYAPDICALELFLESGETCMLHLESSVSQVECLHALQSILGKNKLIRGYPDIDYAWTVRLRYKMQRSPTSSLALLMHGVHSNVGQRFFCLTGSEFLIVYCNLRVPELICPYSFVRQCASRKDGQFRIQLGRASPLGECEVVVQLADSTEARFVHESFARLMKQSGARYRDSFLTDLSMEFMSNFPPLPRPTTLISNTTSNNTSELEQSHVSFGHKSSDSNPEPGPSGSILKDETTSAKRSSTDLVARHSWPRLRKDQQQQTNQHSSNPELLREEHIQTKTHNPKEIALPVASPQNAFETGNHYLEMTDGFEVLQTSKGLTRSSHSERTSLRKGSTKQRRSSFSGGQMGQPISSVLTVLRHRSNCVRATKRSFPVVSRPRSHREDDTLFANVVYPPKPRPNFRSFCAVPSETQRQSLTVIPGCCSFEPSNTLTMCTPDACTRLRAMSDVSTLRSQVQTAEAHYNLRDPEHKWSVDSHPTIAGSQHIRERNRSATNRFSFSSFLSSIVSSSARHSCVATTTPASCSNLVRVRETNVGQEGSTEQEMRPRATTIGPSLLIGQRLAISAHVARWTARLAHVTSTRTGRTKFEPPNPSLIEDPQIFDGSKLAESALPTPDLPLTHQLEPDPSHVRLTFADHYAL